MNIVPITFKQASAFITEHHRHHPATVGCKYCIGLEQDGELIGVAVCGRPVSRHLDDGKTIEINRLCVLDAYPNACSKLYGACCRVAQQMGYDRAITYILASEDGASVRASNFVCEGEAGGTHWTGVRDTGVNTPKEKKQRYVRKLR